MFEWIFLWLIIHQFVKFVVFITLLHKKSIVNSKLKLVIEKKKEQWNGWRHHGEIKQIRIVYLVKKWYDLVCEKIFFFLLSWCYGSVHVLK